MPLTNVVYPIEGSEGVYKNTYPSNKELFFTARRVDQEILSITSGTDDNVKITTLNPMEGVEVGDFVVFGSDEYESQSAKVLITNGADPTEIDVDLRFTSSVSTNGFINYHKNYYLQIRYIRKNSTTSDQNAIELFNDYTQSPNDLDGNIQANITLPAELIDPDFDIATGMADNLSQSYKIQYRESYSGSRSLDWVSPSPDFPLLLIHGTKNIPDNNFTDTEQTKRYVKGYPLMYSFVYSDVNDGGANQVIISATQLDIKQKEIQTDEVFNDFNVNGVGLIYIDPATIDDDCAFITFSLSASSSLGQYSGEDYEPDDYQTVGTEGNPFLPYNLPFTL